MRRRKTVRGSNPDQSNGKDNNPVLEVVRSLGERLADIEQLVIAIHDRLETRRPQEEWKEWYDTGELAQALGVSQHTVQARWCSVGRVECEKDPGSGKWRIPGREFRRLVKGGSLRRPRTK